MKTPIHKRLLSLLLVLALAFPLIPHEVFAETQSGSVDTSLSTSAETPPVSAVDAVLNEADMPDAIDIDRARARGHVRRLLDEEGENLNNMIFENATVAGQCIFLTTLSNILTITVKSRIFL